uniref:plasmid replication protein, CyRepA1 family n=1 Tax=Methylobacterium sp. B34 TaxID=95563 RepID=UPI00034B2091|nr:plasmid replication protein, CyRepA1 family [Methylobacterium sp. B34]
MIILDKRLKIAINCQLIDKNIAGNDLLFTQGFENVELTLAEFGQSIQSGYGYCAQLTGPRCTANFLACDAVSIDVDDGPPLEEAIEHPFIRANASLIYTTVNHTHERSHYRVVFVTPRTITEAWEARATMRALAQMLGGDLAATDATRIFFGHRRAEMRVLGRSIDTITLDELLRAGASNRASSPGIERGFISNQRGFGLKLRPDEPVRRAGGDVVCLSEVEEKAKVHCPVHDDRSPSAFVVVNRRGVKGVHCSACRETFWPDQKAGEGDAIEDFETVVREADKPNGYRPRGFVARFANELLAKEGITGRHIHIVEGRATPSLLLPGITFVKSGKGSGKTEGVKALIRGGASVLAISHRRSLIHNLSGRLGLTSYLDTGDRQRDPDHRRWDEDALAEHRHPVSGNFLGENEVVRPLDLMQDPLGLSKPDKRRYAICLDSLKQLNPAAPYDILVLDEVEQLLAHFLSDTIERRRGGSRDRIFKLFTHFVRTAKYVIALDADLSWPAFVTLCRMVDDRVYLGGQKYIKREVHIWINDALPTQRRVIQLFDSRDHLVADLKQAVAAGKRCFVTANSRGLVSKIAEGLRDEFGTERRFLLVTSRTTSDPSVQEFLKHPVREMERYDVVLASPSIGTGVDITFAGGAEKVDVVYGFLLPKMVSHLDFDQQLARVRHPGEVKVWIDRQTFSFETHPDIVKAGILRESLYKNTLRGYEPDGTPCYVEDDPLIEMAALITAQKQASLNDLRGNFVRYKQAQGFTVTVVGNKSATGKEGRELLNLGAKRLAAETVRQLLAARSLPRPEFVRIGRAMEANNLLSQEEVWAVHRTGMELFYREGITEELILRDDGRRFRERVRLFEKVVHMPAEQVWRGSPRAPLPSRMRFLRGADDQTLVIRRLLQLTPFLPEQQTAAGDSTGGDAGTIPHLEECPDALDVDAVCCQDDLADFAEFVLANKGQVEQALGLEVRRDIRKKAIRQLSEILRMIGLETTSAGTVKVSGVKTYRYRLDGGRLESMRDVVRRRARKEGWPTLAKIYGPHMTPEPEDQDWGDEYSVGGGG